MEAFLILTYEWICILFGIYYVNKKGHNWNLSPYTDRGFLYFLFCVFAVPFYWPLMIIYLAQDRKKKLQLEMEEQSRRLRR